MTSKGHSLPLTPQYPNKNVTKYIRMHYPQTWDVIQDYGKQFITELTPTGPERVIESKTCLQNSAVRWQEERFNDII